MTSHECEGCGEMVSTLWTAYVALGWGGDDYPFCSACTLANLAQDRANVMTEGDEEDERHCWLVRDLAAIDAKCTAGRHE